MQTLTRPLTYRAFREMNFAEHETDEFVFELINGEIVARNYPTASHQRVLKRLAIQFDAFVEQNKLGEVLFAPFGVVLNEHSDVQPDLIFISAAKAGIVREEGVFGIPDLLVEIISPSSLKTDRNAKYKLYEQMGESTPGVTEYWIIDIKNRSVEVHTLQAGSYNLFAFAIEQGAVTSTVLPGLSVAVEAVFEGI